MVAREGLEGPGQALAEITWTSDTCPFLPRLDSFLQPYACVLLDDCIMFSSIRCYVSIFVSDN